MSDENQNDDLFEEKYVEDDKSKKTIRIIALVTALCLLIMIITPLFRNLNLPSLNFLKESFKLTQKPEIEQLQQSIVTITVNGKKGTGFNIDEKGLIVTNAHVVENKKKVPIKFYKGRQFNGEVSKVYPDIDVALIEIDGKDLPKLELDENSEINKNDEILIIGNPLNYNGVANKGVIYGKAKVKGLDVPILLVDAPVNKGNSGSPVINEKEEVIGVIFATVNNENLDGKELGAAIPIEYLKNKIDIKKAR